MFTPFSKGETVEKHRNNALEFLGLIHIRQVGCIVDYHLPGRGHLLDHMVCCGESVGRVMSPDDGEHWNVQLA
jgi:hypothetical protein